MDDEDVLMDTFAQEDHQVAYAFDPDEDTGPNHVKKAQRPAKRRKVTKKQPSLKASSRGALNEATFVPLLNGLEGPGFVRLRKKTFTRTWGKIQERIEGILRDSNAATLQQVSSFMAASRSDSGDQIPAAFLVTGPNIASQDLLFEQLRDTLLQDGNNKFVRLRSSEAGTLKAALKRTIKDATAHDETVEGEQMQDTRKYLDYDLEALEAHIRYQQCEHVFVAIQDSEGFDSTFLSDIITLFHSWRPRIPFTLLLGVATSVELLQARLLKSACHLIYGAQVDAAQMGATLDTVFKGAVAASDVPLRLGAPLLKAMLDRQHEHMAGIQSFISALKYTYMCHFFANPLSVLCSADDDDAQEMQGEHLAAVRQLSSFQQQVERMVEQNTHESLAQAKSLLEDDDYLLDQIRAINANRQSWAGRLLRSLLVVQAAGAQRASFPRAYVEGMAMGTDTSEESGLVENIRRANAEDLVRLVRRIMAVFTEGDAALNLGPSTDESDRALFDLLESKACAVAELVARAEEEGKPLRSKYSGHSKVMRTTVIAQKVQLSRDSAALRDQDKQLTDIVDDITKALSAHFADTKPSQVLFSECWLYQSRSPSREVFVPRPRAAFERSLGRPHDYLGCSCCGGTDGQGLQPTLPAASIVYQLYQETGSLINVADLWTAFNGLVSETEQDERKALVMFYRGLAEMRALGFVKSSKKKVDHVAKVKWL